MRAGASCFRAAPSRSRSRERGAPRRTLRAYGSVPPRRRVCGGRSTTPRCQRTEPPGLCVRGANARGDEGGRRSARRCVGKGRLAPRGRSHVPMRKEAVRTNASARMSAIAAPAGNTWRHAACTTAGSPHETTRQPLGAGATSASTALSEPTRTPSCASPASIAGCGAARCAGCPGNGAAPVPASSTSCIGRSVR